MTTLGTTTAKPQPAMPQSDSEAKRDEPQAQAAAGGLRVKPSFFNQRVSDDLIAEIERERQSQP